MPCMMSLKIQSFPESYEEAWKIDFSEDDFAEWLKDRKEQSVFTSDVIPAADSHILTLSTCSYEYQNARFVLHAVLQGDSCSESQD